jgi:hypothetical protein
MRVSGVDWTYRRESNSTYNESWAGRKNPREKMNPSGFPLDFYPISPFAEDGSLLPLVTGGSATPLGSGDELVQGYNFRLCATYNSSTWLPFPQPTAYNSIKWELVRRLAAVLPADLKLFLSLGSTARQDKLDLNNEGLVSTDVTGLSWGYPAANYSTRQQIYDAHKEFTLGYMYTLQNDPALPASLRSKAQSLGLCADENSPLTVVGPSSSMCGRQAGP